MKKLLPFKIRPFNMANFSGGSGYMVFYYILILLATYPLYFIVSLPLTLFEERKGDGESKVDTKKVKSVMKKIYIPVTAVISVILTVVYSFMGFIYDSGSFVWISYFYCAVSPFIIIFGAIMIAIKRKSDAEGYIKKSTFIGHSVLFVLLLSIAAFAVSLIFMLILG